MTDNYRRPTAKKYAARQAVDGLLPVKTNSADQKIVQPFRAAVITLAEAPERGPTVSAKPRQPPISMALPDDSSQNHHHVPPRIIKQVRRIRIWSLRAAVGVMLLVIGVGGLLGSQSYLKLHKVFKGTAGTAAALQTTADLSQLKGEGDGRINVLLVGIGGAGHDGADLTDTLILASIDPVNHKASLVSVPRDLWVNLPGKGSMKINAAYETGKYAYLHKITSDNSNSKAIQAGFTSIDQTMENVLGVPINYNMLLDFQAFRQAIDTVGGINVDVPSDLYDPTMSWENNHNPYLARAGQQTFDGKHALIYVRSRETSSDFARSERQRAVLLALKQKAITLGVLANPSKLSGLLNAFGNNVQTDLSLSDASRLYNIFKQVDNSHISSVSLAGDATSTSSAAGIGSLITTGNLNGQSIVMPKAGLGDYQTIQDYIHAQLPDGYLLKEHASVLVAGSNTAAVQAQVTKLRSYGYTAQASPTTTAVGRTSTVLVDRSAGKDRYTKHYLQQRYGITAQTKLPVSSGLSATTADFVVLLGDDSSL